ncbi:MAG: hypothetical protein AMXMBFR64_04590 [Myxococcales bacterium]
MRFPSNLVVALAAMTLAGGCKKDEPQPPAGPATPPAQPTQPAQPGAAGQPSQPTQGAPIPVAEQAAGLANIPRKGPADAKVVIIESSDFQCPFCSRAKDTVEKVAETWPKDVAVYFFHNPLAFHPNAMPAAKASMAAHKQGKFWEMHDKLFANARELTAENFDKWAGELGLDMARFKADMGDPEIEKEIKRQQAAMVALGARGTPGFFINGEAIKGAQPFETFKAIVEKKLAETDKAVAEGAPAAKAWQQVAKATHPAGDNFIAWVVDGGQPPVQEEQPAQPARPAVDATVWKVQVGPKDARKGAAEPLVTIVTFSEFQCPFCARVLPTMKQLLDAYPNDVAVVFKHNPLAFHNNAVPAALASIAAGNQGKFWEMHDKLFDGQRDLSAENIDKWATELGLDMARFKADMESPETKRQVEEDQKLASEVNARGTPNSFVNGRQMTGAQPFEAFKALVDEELEKAKKLVDGGTPRGGVYAAVIKDGKVFRALDDTVQSFDLTGVPTKGPANARVQIVEFSDFQCPFCSRVGPVIDEVQSAYGDAVSVTFMQFPLSFHQQAAPAGKAALAAHAQGKFWQMHDKLFANQKELGPEKYEEWARELGLDMEKWKAAMADPQLDDAIKAQTEQGTKAGVGGTPTVFINGRKFQPPSGYNVESFKAVIEGEILGK